MEQKYLVSAYSFVKQGLAQCKNRHALSFYGKRQTFQKVFQKIDGLAYHLSKEVEAGDVVTVCLPNAPSALIAFYALNKIGVVVNLCHPFLPPEQLRDSVKRTNSKLLITFDQYLKKYPEFSTEIAMIVSDSGKMMGTMTKIGYRLTKRVNLKGHRRLEKLMKKSGEVKAYFPKESDAAVYLSSGGTTGNPKTIKLSNYALNYLCGQGQFFLREPVQNYTAMYSVLPIFHGFGLCLNLHMCMTLKFKNVMCMKFSAKKMIKDIQKEGVNIITGVPTMYHKLLAHPSFATADLSSVKDAFAGGDKVDESLIADFNAALSRGGSKGSLYAGYGLTETVTVCAVNTARHHATGSIGYPVPGTEFCVMDGETKLGVNQYGEICVSTPQMMLGYLCGEEDNTFEMDGKTWLKTGDEGCLDENGFLYFKQRIKNIFKVSGVPVYPSEIEDALGKVNGIKRLCAVPMADEIKGNVVKLYVQTEDGADKAAVQQEIMAVAKQKLIAYAVPKRVVFLKELPVNLIGKVDRLKLQSGEYQ